MNLNAALQHLLAALKKCWHASERTRRMVYAAIDFYFCMRAVSA